MHPDWFAQGHRSSVLVQLSVKGHPDLNKRGVPLAGEFARNDDDRQVIELVYSQGMFGRPYRAAARRAAERVAALRKAFMAALNDKSLLAEADKMKFDVEPMSGDEMQALVTRLYATPPHVIERARQALTAKTAACEPCSGQDRALTIWKATERWKAFGAEAAFMATAAGKAFVTLMEPHRLMFLAAGCIMGLVLGIVPGIGGLAGTAMLLPFTFNMDPYSAFALLLGLGSTTATGDPIPAVLFGVPGGAASAATVLDGFPMAKRGEAGRALSAAYMSSLMGGIFGAMLLAVSIPILRPVMLYPRLAGAAGVLRLRHIDGGGAVRQRAAARPRRRLPRHHDRDDRHRSADRHAALDLRQPLSVGRPAADAAAARHLRAAGAVRPADRAHRDRQGDRQGQHLQGPVAGREGLLRELVADRALLLDRRRHRLDPRHQRLGGRLARLRPRAQDREGRAR